MNNVQNEMKKYNIQDLSLQYFIMEKKINDEIQTHEARIRKYNMIKGCIHNEIFNKQQIEEAEKLSHCFSSTSEEESTSDEETITDNDNELILKSSDIQLLDSDESEEENIKNT
jgi:hypothetical protein